MSFLPNSINIYDDESLESALLRLCRANHFQHYSSLSTEVKLWLEEHHPTLSGAYPLALDAVNIYHAHTSSAPRVQALLLLEELIGLRRFSLLNIAFKHTLAVDVGAYADVQYKNLTIPTQQLRQSSIPVCIECLKEAEYARFEWHIKSINHCFRHNQALTSNCPNCGTGLNYMYSEEPSRCLCGEDLRIHTKSEKGRDTWRDDSLYTSIGGCNLSEKLAVLTFVQTKFSDIPLSEFLLSPKQLISEQIIDTIERQLLLATEKVNHLAVSTLTEGILSFVGKLRLLPTTLKQMVIDSIIEIALSKSRSRVANFGDSLLSISETAVILGCSINEVYRLYESGVLGLSKRPISEGNISSHARLFRLRDIASIAISYSKYGFSQSAW